MSHFLEDETFSRLPMKQFGAKHCLFNVSEKTDERCCCAVVVLLDDLN